MKETRAGKYGRFEAAVLKYIIGTIPDTEREDYVSRFLKEFNRYSDKPRRVGEPRNEGCVHKLEGLDDLDVLNPEQLARWIKEGQHLKYQKATTARERASFLENL